MQSRAPIILISTALLLVSLKPLSAADSPRPNILFILADDLGWSDTTLYGTTKFYRTPNIERLANQGVTFTRAYAASPLCSPTRASILTGQNPARIGITSPTCHVPQVRLKASVKPKGPPHAKALVCDSATRFNTTHVTLAERLKESGYATGHFGKWHLGKEPYSPLQHGFDVDIPHWPGPGPAGSFVAPWKFPNFKERTPGEHIEDRMADEAVTFIEQHKDEPFFLNYWQFSVHAPFNAKRKLIEKHRKRVDSNNPQRSPTYAAMVESLDDAVGTLLDTLERLKIADRTVVIFYSDNGGNMYNEVDGTTPTSNVPLRGGKATMYEGGVRVPCIVKWPGVTKANTRSDAMIQSTDFYPTILHLLDLPSTPDHPIDGLNIAATFRGEPFDRGPMFTYFPHQTRVPDNLPPSVSVHHDDWKLIRLFHQGEQRKHAYQLYHLKDDIGEQNNLADRHPELVKELDVLISGFLKETKAVLPQPNPDYDPKAVTTKPTRRKPRTLGPWTMSKFTNLTIKDGVLIIQSTGNDPWLATRNLPKGEGPFTLKISMKSSAAGAGRVYYSTKKQPGFSREQSVDWTVKHDNQSHDYSVKLPIEHITALRLDPATARGEIRVSSQALEDSSGKVIKRWNFERR